MRALVFLLVVVLAGCARPKPTGVLVDPALSILIPADTVFLLAANIENLKKAPLYRKHLANRPVPQLDELGRMTGIDPRKSLWQIVYTSDGKHNVLLARGNFDAEMETRLQRDGAEVQPYKMYHLVGSEQASVVFLNTSTAAMGSVESLKLLLDSRGKSNGPPAAIAARMKDIPYEVQLWAVYIGGSGKLPVQLEGNMANLYRLLGSVNAASVYFDLRDGLKALARGTTANDAEGKQLNDAMKGMVGLGRLSAPENQPDLLRALDGVQVSQEGPTVNLKIEESAELVEKLLAFAGVK